MAASLWYDVTDHDGDLLSRFPMEDANITYRLGDWGINSLIVPLSHPDLTAEIVGPKRTDFLVGVSTDDGSSVSPIQGGMCGTVGLKSHDQFVKIAGVDWLAWLDQPYHFTGYEVDPTTWTQDDVIKFWTQDTQQVIIQDVLDGMYDGTVETLQLAALFLGSGWLQEVTQFIQLGDTQTALDFIKAVGGLVDPYGFDFVCDFDKTIVFYSPKRQTVESATPFALFTPSSATGLVDIDWENRGPLATASVGMPTAALMKYYSYTPSRIMFRKWLEIIPLNEYYRSNFEVQQATNDIGGLHSNPQKANTITVLAERVDPFDETVGFYNHCGQVVYVDSETEFHPYWTVDAPYVVSQQEIFKQEGNWMCRMTLDQIY